MKKVDPMENIRYENLFKTETEGFQSTQEQLQNNSTIQVQRDDFAKNINRTSQPPPHAFLVLTLKTNR